MSYAIHWRRCRRHFTSFKANSYSEAQKRRAFEITDRPTEVHQRLVDDLLDVNRISQGLIQLKKEQIELRSPIKGAIDAFLPAIERKVLNFNFVAPIVPSRHSPTQYALQHFNAGHVNFRALFNQRLHRANLPKTQTLPSAETWTRSSHRPLNWTNCFSIWIHSGMNTLGQEYCCCKMRCPLHYHSYK
jgi:hypothetical protein